MILYLLLVSHYILFAECVTYSYKSILTPTAITQANSQLLGPDSWAPLGQAIDKNDASLCSSSVSDSSRWISVSNFVYNYSGVVPLSAIQIKGLEVTIKTGCEYDSSNQGAITSFIFTKSGSSRPATSSAYFRCDNSVKTVVFGSPTTLFGFTTMLASEVSQVTFSFVWSLQTGYLLGLGSLQGRVYEISMNVYWATNTNILSINPNTIYSRSGGDTINISTDFATDRYGTIICRFGTASVQGQLISPTLVGCVAPSQLLYGVYGLSISLNSGVNFSNMVNISYSCDEATVCSSKGICRNDGTCQCFQGWQGTDCSVPRCNLLGNCNGNGVCTAIQNQPACNCTNGWIGDDCSQPDCSPQNNCSGNGNCISPFTCQCNSGFTTRNCSVYECSLVNDCNGVNFGGNCTGPNTCTCNPGYSGPTCQALCTNVSCSFNNNTFCQYPNQCGCLPGWSLPNCTTRLSCPLVNNCSQKGDCTSETTCACIEGWKGTNCSEPDCRSLNDCNLNGQCIGPSNCSCFSGWIGDSCNRPYCGMDDCNSTNFHGVCIAPFTCGCNSGWSGSQCNSVICESPTCTSNQTCVGPNLCECLPGLVPPSCTPRIYNCSSLNDCSSRGECVNDSLCQCYSGWRGLNCTIAICDTNCSGKGFCGFPNVCYCYNPQDTSLDCSGNYSIPSTTGRDGGFFEESSSTSSSAESNSGLLMAVLIPLTILLLILIILVVALVVKRRKNYYSVPSNNTSAVERETIRDIELSSTGIPLLTDIEVKEKLGGGNFGEVYRGLWNKTPVALKMLKDNAGELMKEAAVLFNLGMHPHVVQFLGRYNSPDGNIYLVTEFMSKGSLDVLLKQMKDKLSLFELLNMAIGACRGMVFLESKKVIHRDLSCRNLLVSKLEEGYSIKVSDFGMSKIESTYYKASSGSSIPVRWAAPEVLEQGYFSSPSDVWAFGVVVWEILTYAKLPFNWLSNREVAEVVPKGERLPQPSNCPDTLWLFITSCWHLEPEKRPHFKQLLEQLTNLCSALFGEEDRKYTFLLTQQTGSSDSSEVIYNQARYSASPHTLKEEESVHYITSPTPDQIKAQLSTPPGYQKISLAAEKATYATMEDSAKYATLATPPGTMEDPPKYATMEDPANYAIMEDPPKYATLATSATKQSDE